MRLAIADPPYPPMFSVRYDDVLDPRGRVTVRSRACRWYGELTAPARSQTDYLADQHENAAEWDDLERHRELLEQLCDEFDGWALATTPDGLGAYHPLPIEAKIMPWVKPTAPPGSHRIRNLWEPVIVMPPPGRRARAAGVPQVPDVLTATVEQVGFVGAKPRRWVEWVLDALGFDPFEDELVDLFPGTGVVAEVAAARSGVLA